MRKNICSLLVCLGSFAGALTLTGCESENDKLPSQASVDDKTAYARFNPVAGVIPFPNNLLFSGSEDGTLNIPVSGDDNYANPQVALNVLDGFSTLAPITAQTSTALDPDSVIAGQTVRVFEVQLAGIAGPVAGVTRELVPNQDYVAGLSPLDLQTLVITPLTPLAGSTSYVVTLNGGLKTRQGSPLGAELYYALVKGDAPLVKEGASQFSALTDEQAQQMEQLRQLTFAAETAVEKFTIGDDSAAAVVDQPRAGIILSWTFTTQSIGASLKALAGQVVTPQTLVTVPTGMATDVVLTGSPGLADIHIGTLEVPYYLSAPSEDEPHAPLTRFWRGANGGFLTAYNPLPQESGIQTIPLLLTLPNKGEKPADGWPVVIFQHGITQNRTNLLAIADALASAGFAGIAIDLPLHGITDEGNALHAKKTPFSETERTFDLDVVDAYGQPGQDGVVDPSGTHFINLRSLLTTRDNVRQAVADLLTLRASLVNVSDLDASEVYFVGHSLGAMVGTTFLALAPQVGPAVLGMPGGGIAKLLDGSAEFGPKIAAGLAASGVVKGSAEYEAFLMAAQTVVDTVDPLNHAAAAAQGRGVLLLEVVGGNSAPPDQVMPNNVMAAAPPGTTPSPTAGTDPLARVMGLTRYSETTAADEALKAWVRFNAGHHGSLLSPFPAGYPDPLSGQVFTEMQTQTATYLGSRGTRLPISEDPKVVETAAP